MRHHEEAAQARETPIPRSKAISSHRFWTVMLQGGRGQDIFQAHKLQTTSLPNSGARRPGPAPSSLWRDSVGCRAGQSCPVFVRRHLQAVPLLLWGITLSSKGEPKVITFLQPLQEMVSLGNMYDRDHSAWPWCTLLGQYFRVGWDPALCGLTL